MQALTQNLPTIARLAVSDDSGHSLFVKDAGETKNILLHYTCTCVDR